ncbi:MAG TPA: hypothetical protein PK385_02490 [Spirochaetota bacterium]|nr:hypothetical protein [Spirochaetota bacterium]HOS31641.1 hypothetical protein [Spirochaetota bacterium]HOS54907.1 hypothetical protein [Spirochaetota bacterium]HPK62170.1 hypothetical protein [Spirochaetota bacterium]HQF77249.1 hypothetical protein [Spirochaetota bacterium]
MKRGTRTTTFFIILSILFSFLCETTANSVELKKGVIPGIKTMRKYGTRLTPETLLDEIAYAMSGITGGEAALSIYECVLESDNYNPVYVVKNIEFDKNGMATLIEGRVETPRDIRSYIAKGGGGIPVYEPAEPNEFGLIFGRKGNIAVRDGVTVLKNSLKDEEFYSLRLGSEIYDKIMTASLLFQAYEVAQNQYLENMIIELEGMLLNTSSKDALLEGIKQFKKKNKKMNDKEIMVNFLLANKSYLDEIKQSNKEALERIRTGGEFVNAIGAGCALQVVAIVEMFAAMTLETAAITLSLDPFEISKKIAEYVAKNVPSDPKFSSMTKMDLDNISAYGKFYQKRYETYLQKNRKLFDKVVELQKYVKI